MIICDYPNNRRGTFRYQHIKSARLFIVFVNLKALRHLELNEIPEHNLAYRQCFVKPLVNQISLLVILLSEKVPCNFQRDRLFL